MQKRFAILDDGTGRRVFIKAYASDAMIHRRRGARLHEIGTDTGLFQAPALLAFAETQGIALWEHIEDPLSLRDVLIRSVQRQGNREADRRRALALKCGEALGAIHMGFAEFEEDRPRQPLRIPAAGPARAMSRIRSAIEASPARPVHGDYTVTNIFLAKECPGKETIVVIDPAPNPYLFQGTPASVSCPAILECALWYYSLRFHRETSRALEPESRLLLEGFLEGYRRQAGAAPTPEDVEGCASLIALQFLFHFSRQPSLIDFRERFARRYRLRTARQFLANMAAGLPPASIEP